MQNLVDIQTDIALVGLFADQGWDIKIDHLPHMITYTVPNEAAYDLLMDVGAESLGREACRFLVFVQIKATNEIIKIPANGAIVMNASSLVTVSRALNISPAMYEAYGEILSAPSGAGLVRLSDGLQLALNERSDGTLVSGATINDAVQWTRDQYWKQAHLDDFLRQTRQALEPNNVNSRFTMTYDVFDHLKYSDRAIGSQNCNRRITSEYRLVFNGGDPDDLVNYFHLGKNLNIEAIG